MMPKERTITRGIIFIYMSAFTVFSLDLGTGLTTEQMLSRRIYENAGWDLDTVWMICEGAYPTLQWETLECDDL